LFNLVANILTNLQQNHAQIENIVKKTEI